MGSELVFPILMKSHNKLWLLALLYFFALSGALSQAIDSQSEGDLKERIQGDIGVAVYSQNNFTQSGESSTQILPYAYFDYDRFFARIDTFGFKTIPLGMGYLEIVGRYNQEGFTPKSSPYSLLNPRNLPVPLGLGTFQLTPFGAFFIYGFNDFNASKGGKMAEFTYAAEVKLPLSINIYPLIGFDYKDKKYVNYFYGVTPAESQVTGLSAYTSNGGISPYAALALEVPLGPNWVINSYFKHKWLAPAITNSPLVSDRHVDNFFISLDRHFE